MVPSAMLCGPVISPALEELPHTVTLEVDPSTLACFSLTVSERSFHSRIYECILWKPIHIENRFWVLESVYCPNDLSPRLRNHIYLFFLELSMMVQACHTSAGEAETGRSWVLLASKPSLIVEFEVSDESLTLQTNKQTTKETWGMTLRLTSGLHMYPYTCTCTHTNAFKPSDGECWHCNLSLPLTLWAV